MESQYDKFAADYEWLFSDRVLADGPYYFEGLRPILEQLPADPLILDSACGTGVAALALARRGYNVTGTDASEGMIAQSTRHAAKEGLSVQFSVCPWERLPDRFGQEFDLALCCGNAIGNCRDEGEMLRSLRGIRHVLKPGGWIIADTRNWEKVLAERVRFIHFDPRVREGKRCIPVMVWTFPGDPSDRVLVEVVFLFEQDGEVTLRSYPITYYPFRVEELLGRMRSAGFADAATDYSHDKPGYQVTGRKERM